jgi:hypothetical protein
MCRLTKFLRADSQGDIIFQVGVAAFKGPTPLTAHLVLSQGRQTTPVPRVQVDTIAFTIPTLHLAARLGRTADAQQSERRHAASNAREAADRRGRLALPSTRPGPGGAVKEPQTGGHAAVQGGLR